jgi:cobalt/nickel transport system permease protein
MMEVVERSLKSATEYFQNFFSFEYHRSGFLQSVDVRLKLLGIVVLILATVSTFKISKVFAIFFSALVLAKLSNVGLRTLISRVWLFTLFSFLIVLPLAFIEGWNYVLAFTFRVFTAIILIQILVLTTPFNELFHALRYFKIPETLVFALGITYRYVYMMFTELLRILIARESRRLKKLSFREIWENGGKALGAYFIRVFEKGERVQMAMKIRGDRARYYHRSFRIGTSEALFIVFTTFVLTWWLML